MRSFCSGQLPTKHGAAKHVGSEGHESKAGRGGGEKAICGSNVVINGEEQMTKDPAADANPITTNTLSATERTLYIT